MNGKCERPRDGGLVGIFLDFYGTVAAGDVRAVESVCRAVIETHGLNGTCRGADGVGVTLEKHCSDLARSWGMRYFAAIEEDPVEVFRNLTQIEHDTLVETIGGLVKGFDARPFIKQLNAYLANPPLFPEVAEVMAALRLPVCIVSNIDERELRAALEVHGLRFDYVVTSEAARCYKPHPGIFRYALEMTGWPAGRVLHVGDSLHSDVGGAAPLGIRTAWVNRAERISDIGTAVAEFTWEDLRPLADVR